MRSANAEGGQSGQKPHIPNAVAREKSRRTLRIGNVEAGSIEQIHSLIGKSLGSPLNKKLKTVSHKNGAALLVCADTTAVKDIFNACRNKELEMNGKKLYFELFQEKSKAK